MKWFRFYSEVMHDPKVQTLRLELFKFWVNLMCLANEQADRGTLPSADHIAFALRLKVSQVSRNLEELCDLKLLDIFPDGSMSPHNWHSRQRRSDDVADRVRAHRKKTSEIKTPPNGTFRADTCNVTGNVTETPPARVDTDTDSELHTQDPHPPGPGANPDLRNAEDLGFINSAIDRLTGQIETEGIGHELGRQYNTPDMFKIPGWKFWVATYRIFLPGVARSARGSFPYFCKCAFNATPEQFEEARVLESTSAEPSTPPASNGPSAAHRPAAHREDAGERRERKNKEAAERMKERDRANNSNR